MQHLLGKFAWHTLLGPHARYASGTSGARRYVAGFAPIVGFEDLKSPSFDALLPHCEPGEHLYCAGWSGTAPLGWRVESETTAFTMVWNGAVPDPEETPQAVRLGAQHAQQALELATSTRSGPFGPRTLELGEYLGCFEGERLVAMAGERMQAAGLREISGVCTHPDFQGRGLARRLVTMLIQRQLQRQETPFLHVMRDNRSAHRLYERMGFCNQQESVVRVVSRC